MSGDRDAPITGHVVGDSFVITACFIVLFYIIYITRKFIWPRWYGKYRAPLSLDKLDQAKEIVKRWQQAPILPTAPGTRTPFVYQKLESTEHTRLLVLHHGQDDSPLRCSLQEVKVGKWGRSFETVSYRWAGEDRTILCGEKELKIQSNLYDLLVELRLPHDDRYLWADAICIDQKNEAEKTAQVQLMTEIYTQCDSCVVWLGWHSEYMALAFGLLSIILAKEAKGKLLSVMRIFTPGSGHHHGSYAVDDLWKAVGHLLANEWFDRIWTLQEGVLSARLSIRCGKLQMEGSDFFKSLNLFREALSNRHNTGLELQWSNIGEKLVGGRISFFSELSDMRQRFHDIQEGHENQPVDISQTTDAHQLTGASSSSDPLDLFQTLRRVRRRNAKYAHDKVIGVLGLFKTASSQLSLDYSEPLSVTYAKTAEYIMSSCKDMKPLRLLSAAAFDPSVWHDLPSWIPNWEDQTLLVQETLWEHSSEFCAGGQESPEYTVQDLRFARHSSQAGISESSLDSSKEPGPQRRRLHVRGKLITTLKSFIERPRITRWHKRVDRIELPRAPVPVIENTHWQVGDHQKYLLECYYLICKEHEGASGSGISTRQATSLLGQILARGLVLASEDQDRWFPDAVIDSVLFSTLVDYETRFGDKYLHQHRPFFDEFDAWTTWMKFAVTNATSEGWVPLQAQADDWVCVIQGCDLPFVLREITDDGTFVVIGKCCFPDIMRGEAMQDENIRLREIILD